MNIIIVEDEGLAAERLAQLIQTTRPDVQIRAVLDSVEDAVDWLRRHPHPDLGFFDIQLADGLSFSIFDSVTIAFPIIFTTAYDQYSLRAFQVNSIDYLLKPIDPVALERAFNKIGQLKKAFGANATPSIDVDILREAFQQLQRTYKSRFVVNSGQQLISVSINDIAYFTLENRIVWLRLLSGHRHAVDYSLEQLETMLDPRLFFRINRQYLAHIEAVKSATPYSNSRLRVHLPHVPDGERVIVSRDKAQAFRDWLDG